MADQLVVAAEREDARQFIVHTHDILTGFWNYTRRFIVNLNSNEHGLVQFWLDPLPPLFYDFASCSQDGAADGLCMGRRTRGSDPS